MTRADELQERIARLSPAHRAIFLRKLRDQGIEVGAPDRIVAQAHGDLAPVSFAQERIWFLSELVPNHPFYTEPLLVIRLEGALDAGALGSTVQEIVRRHEILRTRFP